MIRAEKLAKKYVMGKVDVYALRGVSVTIGEGEFVAIMGPSGSGKSTLLHLLALLDPPTGGRIYIGGADVLSMTEEEKTAYRLRTLGFVFQDYAILPELSTLENVFLPALTLGAEKHKYLQKAKRLLRMIGLEDRMGHYPAELSGGQQQRVSIARALMNDPKILFADEPCANLDTVSSKQVLELFQRLNRETGQTIVMVTHEESHRSYALREIWLKDGQLDKKSGWAVK